MTQPIDTAYVDIVPVDKSLQKLQSDIDKAMKKIDKQLEKDLKKIDKDFDDTFSEIDRHFADMNKDADKRFRELEKIVDSSLDDVKTEFDQTFSFVQNKFTEFGNESERSFKQTRAKFLEPLADGLRSIGGVVSDLGRAMFQLVSGIGGAITSNPLAALIIALIPAVIALSAALGDLVGLATILPAGLGVLLAAILPLVIAFQNFGDAVSAVASGDVEKIDEALSKLSVSARFVAREIGTLLPLMREFQKNVQEAFFGTLRGVLTQVIGTLIPALRGGVGAVATSFGLLIRSFANLLTTPNTIKVLNDTLNTTSRIIDKLAPPLTRLFDALFKSTGAGLPLIERLATAFGKALDSFSAFLTKSIETGEFNRFFEEALLTLRELIDLGKAVGGLLSTLFGGTDDAGRDFIQTLTDLTTRLDKFLESAEGQDALKLLVFTVKALGLALGVTLDSFIFLFNVFRSSMKALEALGRGFTSLLKTIGDFLSKVPNAVEEFFSGLPDKIVGFFQTAFDRALQVIGIGIGLILFAITELPNQIARILMSLPQRIYNLLVAIIPFVASALQGAVDIGRNIVVNGFNAIVEFIKSVPDRIRDLIPNFSRAGKSLIESFMNGFRAVGSFIGDVAGDIVRSVKGFLNKAIDKINSGIASIDAVLPGDLARIPRLAEGALVRHRTGGILANVGEGSEDEVVAPLSKLEGMLKGGPNITFGANAVNVSFNGTVPTAQEARETGEAVGHGILGIISRHRLRAEVRAI